MTMAAGWLWGMFSGLLGGALVGALTGPFVWLLYVAPDVAETLTLFEQLASGATLGLLFGGVAGAALGTALGVGLALFGLTADAAALGAGLAGMLGLLGALFFIQDSVAQLAVTPLLGLFAPGLVGWVNGAVLEWRSDLPL